MQIIKGTKFDTPYETGCVALEEPDYTFSNKKFPHGNFVALDSDGVECLFSTAMVIGHEDYKETK